MNEGPREGLVKLPDIAGTGLASRASETAGNLFPLPPQTRKERMKLH